MVAEIKAQSIQGHHIHPLSLFSPLWRGGNPPHFHPHVLGVSPSTASPPGNFVGVLPPGMHLLWNTRKSGRTPQYGKKRWPSFSAQKGDTHCTETHRCVRRTNGTSPPKTPFPVCWTTEPRQKKKHLVLQGLFFRLIKRERSSFTTKTAHPSSTQVSTHLSSVTLFVQNQL